MKLRYIFFILALQAVAATLGAPAWQQPFEFTQPDGTVLTVTLRGDEHGHCYVTDDGQILLDKDGALYYATLSLDGRAVASPRLAMPANLRSADDNAFLYALDQAQIGVALGQQAVEHRQQLSKDSLFKSQAKAAEQEEDFPLYGLFPGVKFPSTGECRGLVILVEYQDTKYTLTDPHDYFSRLLNEEGFSEYKATGSARDYFIDQSMGQFVPQFDVYGPVTLSREMSYYGSNLADSGADAHAVDMVVEACNLLDDQIDFSEYDLDNDGLVDNIFLFYAGYGENAGGPVNSVWPHSTDLTEWGDFTPEELLFDGVTINHYACTNEWQAYYNQPDGIGVFCHEFSHVLGLPDLYDVYYMSGAFEPGDYSIMCSGSYLNYSRTPPAYTIYERTALGWMRPQDIQGPGLYRLDNIATNNGAIIRSNFETEYYLLECREKTGWDTYIPGEGMLVWHIDYMPSLWETNTVNTNSMHQYIDIVEADDIRTEATRDGDTFPGASNVTSFTDDTTPSMITWKGARLNTPLTDIAFRNHQVLFRVSDYHDAPQATVAAKATNIKGDGFTARWDAVDFATHYLVTVLQDGIPVEGWYKRDAGNTTMLKVDGLVPLTDYSYLVYAVDKDYESEPSNEVTLTTRYASTDGLAVVAIEATDIMANGFTANWEPTEGATAYLVTVNTDNSENIDMEVVDFTDGVKNLPSGWSTTSIYSFSQSGYYGEEAPALKFSEGGSITSPEYDEAISRVKFWYRGNNAALANAVTVEVQLAGDSFYQEIERYEVSNQQGVNVDIEDIPTGAVRMRINYEENSHKGTMAIDDIKVIFGEDTDLLLPIDGYQDLDAGNSLSLSITGLNPATEYIYTVVATDGTYYSYPSNEVKVITKESELGINDVESSTLYYVNARYITLKDWGQIWRTDGRLVFQGQGTVSLTPGFYILSINGNTAKILIK